MMLTKEQEGPVHQAAVKFAIACYEAPERPRGSVILAAAEELACRMQSADATERAREAFEAVVHTFEYKVGKLLALLRNESERGAMRG